MNDWLLKAVNVTTEKQPRVRINRRDYLFIVATQNVDRLVFRVSALDCSVSKEMITLLLLLHFQRVVKLNYFLKIIARGGINEEIAEED